MRYSIGDIVATTTTTTTTTTTKIKKLLKIIFAHFLLGHVF